MTNNDTPAAQRGEGTPQKAWRVRPWCQLVPCSPAFFYKQLPLDGELRRNVVKIGRMTIVTESRQIIGNAKRESTTRVP